jgi:cysteinyl-tRNA synthetase
MHANMLNVNGQKMSKSLGNFFLPKEIVEGTTPLFKTPYSPAVIRFFMMQAHYRSTLDFTEDALNAATKGFTRLSDAMQLMKNIETSSSTSFDCKALCTSFYEAMNDDFNAPILIAHLFEAVKYINLINDKKEQITKEDLELLQGEMHLFVVDVLGLKMEIESTETRLAPVMDLVLNLRQKARENKDWTTSDQIRDGLAAAGITIKDSKEGSSWS